MVLHLLSFQLDKLEVQVKKAFKAPPKEWIEHRLENLHETLQKNTTGSALALKGLLGTIYMEGVAGECRIENENLIQEKPYYIAHSKIQTLALLDDKTKGSNWLQMRTRLQPIRTFSEITFKVKFM